MGTVEVNLRTFRQRHSLAYQCHHKEYPRRATTLRNQLGGRSVRVRVPAQLIRIRELGETVDVSYRFEDLAASVGNCSLESDLDFESAPWSNRCKLPIDETAPERKALEIFGAMDASMREYNRRFSTSPHTDTLINLIQAAGPSSLENVLDEGVITFIKGFIK